jgi:hypothetical protein
LGFEPRFISGCEFEQPSPCEDVGGAGHAPAPAGHFFEVFLFHRLTADLISETAAWGMRRSLIAENGWGSMFARLANLEIETVGGASKGAC